MKEYSWNTGGLGFFKIDANIVGKELEKIEDELTAENVVELARDKDNVLHNLFEWDDKKASEEYRKIQAGTLIRSIRVTVISDNNKDKVKTRAFVTLKKNTKYEPIEKVVTDVDKYAILLNRAYKELYAFKQKYSTLEEIQELLKDIPVVA